MASKRKDKDIYTARHNYFDRHSVGTDIYPELNVKISTIDTTLLLLDSEEEPVLATVFKHITEFMLKQDDNIRAFRDKELLDILLEKEFFCTHPNTIIKRFALYDADLIIESMNTLTDLTPEKTREIIDLTLDYYLKETDDFCIEYLSVIHNKCCDDPQVAQLATTSDDFIIKFFDMISRTTNPDVLLHSLEALYKMLQVQSTENYKAFVMHDLFPLDRILCDITNEYGEIRTATLRLVKMLIADTSDLSPFGANRRQIFALDQLTQAFCNACRKSNLDDVVEALATGMRSENITKIFFERNYFERIVDYLHRERKNFAPATICRILAIFAENAKYTQFLYRLHVANITEMFIECVLAMDNPPVNAPAMHVILGLNRLMKFPDAAQLIIAAYSASFLVKLLQIISTTVVSIKTREQTADLIGNLLTYAFVVSAEELMQLNFPKLLAEILAQNMEDLSIDFIISLLNIIEALAQNEAYRAQLGEEALLSQALGLLLKNSFTSAVLTSKLFRCLCTIIDEDPVRYNLLTLSLSSSIQRALKSLSNQVKTAVTNFIMQTTRFPELLTEYVDRGVLEVLIVNQKHSHCVSTWGPAIESILSKTPTLKFCIRNHLGFTDNTSGQDFHVSKKKFEDFREFQSILREEVSPLFPVFIVNFERLRDPSDFVIFIPPELLRDIGTKIPPEGWCYCRQPGDEILPQYLEELNKSLERQGLRTDAAHARRCVDFDNLAKRVKVIAELVARVMNQNLKELDLNSSEECSEHIVRCHLKELCVAMHCSILPLGKVHSGCLFERAVLFKCLADQIGLPTTLQRSVDGRILFNEVPLPVQIDRDIHCDERTMQFMPWRMLRPTHIVDLLYNVGELYPLQSRQALQYLRLY